MPHPINAKCNFRCTFCDRNWSREEAAPVDHVLHAAPMSELGGMRAVLGGGEPTLHPKLPQILAGLRQQGARKVALRTNAAWASREGPVQFLKKQGMTEATVLFVSHEPEVFDRLTRKAGAYDAVMKGIANLAKHRLRVSLRVPLLRPTLASLPELLRRLPELVPTARRVDLVWLDIDDPELQITAEQLNATLPHGSDHDIPGLPPLFLDAGPGVALCMAETLARWTISPDDPTAARHHPAACGDCYLKPSCPGILRGVDKVFGSTQQLVKPYHLDYDPERPRPAETGASGPFEAVKGVTYECPESEAGGELTLASVRLRVGHTCNRRCDFCFIPHHEKSVQDYDIRASIEAAVEKGVRELVMTGGEPTLVQELPDYIELARDGGVRRIILQTNAMRLADPDFCEELVSKGLTHVVISLHAHEDAVLQSITGLPNTMQRILRSIDNLHAAGIQMSVTHVIGPKNYRQLPDFVRFMSEQSHIRRYCFIFATPMAWPMAKKELVVRYSDAAPYMMEALDYCIDNGIIVDGLSFKCGAPHCVVGGEPKYLVGAVKIPEKNRTPDWIEVPACKVCVLRDQCYGVRRLYTWLYGVDEFQPVLDPAKRIDAPPAGSPAVRRALPLAGQRAAMDQARGLIEQVGQRIGLSSAQLAAVQRPSQVIPATLRGPDDASVAALRVRFGPEDAVQLGGLELCHTVDQQSCTTTALLRHLRLAAMELPVCGAHGQLAARDGETAGLIKQYVQSLQGTKPAGTDHLTPHTSTPWAEVEAAVARHNADRPPEGQRVGLLRRTLTGPLAELRMTSLDSALAATAAALDKVTLPDTRVRYAVWGYGRAGQRYAALMDKLVVQGRRAMLVGLADSQSAQVLVHGLEHERATVFKQRNGRIPAGAGASDDPADVLRAPADVLLLSGRGPALTLDLLPALQARVVVDLTGAVSPDIERALLAQGVVFVPSLIATAGPLVMAELERTGALDDVAAARAAIHRHTARLFARASAAREQHGLSMTEAVVSMGLTALCRTEDPYDKTGTPSQL